MKEVILLVGHGSRHPKGNEEIEQFCQQIRSQKPNHDIELCFIEFADVLLDQGLDNAAKKAQRVIVIPLILNAAGHVKMEIPAHIAQARTRHPQVEFVYARHLGANMDILGILKKELRQVMNELDVPDPRTTGIILLARGSSDRVANGEVAKMARWLFEETDHDLVEIAFTGITYPRLETVAQRMQRLGMSQVVVLPYYLFTGTLIERIQRQVQHLRQLYPGIRFGLGQYFGFSDSVFELVHQRMQDHSDTAPQMECDGCKYREVAEEHGHGHHHHDHAHEHEHEHDHVHQEHQHEH